MNDLDNCGYARACNSGAYLNQDRARNLAFFNADTRFVDNNCVDYCVERLSRREAAASFVDDAGLTLALALLPWIVLIQIMF